MESVDPTEDQAAGDEEGDGEADRDGDIDIVPDSDDNVTEPAVQNTDHDLPQTDGEDDNDSDGDEPGEEKESTPITRSTRSGKVAPVQLPPKKRGWGRPKILTHSRRDLLNVMDFEYLQLGGFLGIMSVKEFWKKTN